MASSLRAVGFLGGSARIEARHGPDRGCGDALGPSSRLGVAAQQILADLDQRMGQAPPLAMDGYGVVAGIVHSIGPIVAKDEGGVAGEAVQQRAGQAPVAVVRDADQPRTRLPRIVRREAVDGIPG